jgi:hypothetical protein
MLFAASITVPLCPRPFPTAFMVIILIRAAPLAIGFSMHGEECLMKMEGFRPARKVRNGSKPVSRSSTVYPQMKSFLRVSFLSSFNCGILTIYAPMIYTAPCVMFLMLAD